VAPDWATKASRPGTGLTWEKLALRPMPGTMTPKQLGPMRRSRKGWAASSIACLSSNPRRPAPSPKPVVMTTAAPVPRAPSAATMPGTVAGGVQMIARSGIEGRLAMSVWQGIPSTAWYFGLTASTRPSKPAPDRLRATTLPTEARVWLAPSG
jgi:hypothetical protein